MKALPYKSSKISLLLHFSIEESFAPFSTFCVIDILCIARNTPSVWQRQWGTVRLSCVRQWIYVLSVTPWASRWLLYQNGTAHSCNLNTGSPQNKERPSTRNATARGAADLPPTRLGETWMTSQIVNRDPRPHRLVGGQSAEPILAGSVSSSTL